MIKICKYFRAIAPVTQSLAQLYPVRFHPQCSASGTVMRQWFLCPVVYKQH
ncbi:hypothetical protein TTHERM_000730368 (macronuclear) [Tetrahymena thermophila SB210]|uniref:Uncharacterized protein n=1 Tax=Tetrahymena thermophila (strain SB210) TaxID=312017 RepID=W7XGP1_TETTS|nr:hypothetical protein TTHERM_000730368 [Tetrahymena thermophila SB210]EWS72129.1 hypothetical protein TTHERM_000730368 [Tetrahymena thermophila SB210]|eukprot:XP_012655322.1 hypothetical protein TTHERM_000730368 [Tetrahymena thermophila SB210]